MRQYTLGKVNCRELESAIDVCALLSSDKAMKLNPSCINPTFNLEARDGVLSLVPTMSCKAEYHRDGHARFVCRSLVAHMPWKSFERGSFTLLIYQLTTELLSQLNWFLNKN